MPHSVSLGQLRAAVRGMLADADVQEPHFEADQIVARVMELPRAHLHAHPETIVPPLKFSKIIELAILRSSGEPLGYVLGDALFCGRTFFVDHRVLIPRPETEILTQWADRLAKATPAPGVFADWCTGSGCIAVTLLLDNPGWRAFAVDSSPGALAVARENAERAGVGDRVEFICCARPREAAEKIPAASLDFIVSNPPYIPTNTISSLEPQVRDHEPREALDGGPDGLDVCRLLLEELPYFMKQGAPFAFETGGADQVDLLAGEARGVLAYAESFADGLGIRRFMVWRNAA